VIEREVASPPTAVLATVVVASEQIASIECNLLADGSPNVPRESNHARDGHSGRGCSEHGIGILNSDGNVRHEKLNRSFHATDVKWLEAGVEDQYPCSCRVGKGLKTE